MRALILLFPSVALAVPATLSHQGRLIDDEGFPVEGDVAVTLSLYGSEDATTASWSEARTVAFDDGFYSVVLGDSETFASDLFDSDALWIGLTVDGEELGRVAVNSVPFAIRADTTANVRGGTVEASSVTVGGSSLRSDGLSVNGVSVIDADGFVVANTDWTTVQSVPPDLADGDQDSFADLSCTAGQVPLRTDTGWACADLDDEVDATEPVVATYTHGSDVFDVLSWSLGVETLINFGSTSGGAGAGRPQLDRLTLRIAPSADVAGLLRQLAVGLFAPTTSLSFGGHAIALQTVYLSDAQQLSDGTWQLDLIVGGMTVSPMGGTPVTWSFMTSSGDPTVNPAQPPAPGATDFQFGVESAVNIGSSSGGGSTGRAGFREFTWQRPFDAEISTYFSSLLLGYMYADFAPISATWGGVDVTAETKCTAIEKLTFHGTADGLWTDVVAQVGAMQVTLTERDDAGEVADEQVFIWSIAENRERFSCTGG